MNNVHTRNGTVIKDLLRCHRQAYFRWLVITVVRSAVAEWPSNAVKHPFRELSTPRR